MTSPNELGSDSSRKELVDFGIYYLDMVECPLNPDHKLRRHRLPYHLVKCRKNFPSKVQCPYGHYFFLEQHEMAHHLQICDHKSRTAEAEQTQPHKTNLEHIRNTNKTYNYDVENYQIGEPYWD